MQTIFRTLPKYSGVILVNTGYVYLLNYLSVFKLLDLDSCFSTASCVVITYLRQIVRRLLRKELVVQPLKDQAARLVEVKLQYDSNKRAAPPHDLS